MKVLLVISFCLLVMGCSSIDIRNYKTGTKQIDLTSKINEKKWFYGSVNCKQYSKNKIDVFALNEQTYILRQSKCSSYEAPFIYVFIGSKTVAVVDTGTTKETDSFPLYETIMNLVEMNQRTLLVLHTHSHSDHHGADEQFKAHKNVTIIEPSPAGLTKSLGFTSNLAHEIVIDLGGRKLTLFQIPGHQEESIAVYDTQSQWLLTGDTLYPGAIYVKNWQAFKSSIERLANFSAKHTISAVLGAHVEMTMSPGEFYSIGSTYQPDEAPLALGNNHIHQLYNSIKTIMEPTEMVFDDFVIIPLGSLQKALASTVKFVTGQ